MKIKTLKCILALILVFSSLLSLSSCAKVKPIESSVEDSRIVGKIGEFEIRYEELRFAIITQKKLFMDTYGDAIFETPESAQKYSAEILAAAYDSIKFNYAILTMCQEVAMDVNDPEILEAVQKTVEDTVSEIGSMKKYKGYLAENALTDSLFRFNIQVDKLRNELFYVYVDDLGLIKSEYNDIAKSIETTFVRTQHVYISKNNGRSYEENRSRIEEAYRKLEEGCDFMQAVKDYGEDSEAGDDGFYFPVGYMNETYELCAFSLEKGEYSEIIEDSNGFYIIKRLPQDSLYVMMNFDTLSKRYQDYAFLAMINEVESRLTFIPNELASSIEVLDIN